MITRFISAYAILAKFNRDYKNLELAEPDAIEWIGEALGFVNSLKQTEEKVAFIEVKDHRCKFPTNMINIIQIARDTQWIKKSCDESIVKSTNTAFIHREGALVTNYAHYVTPQTVLENITTNQTDTQAVATLGACKLMGSCRSEIDESKIRYYTPYFDLVYNYQLWGNSHYYQEKYRPVYLSDNSFFSSIVCSHPDAHDSRGLLNHGNRDEYVPRDPYLQFSFAEGSVAVAYNALKTSDDGYPMVPDNKKFKEAITRYLLYKTMSNDYYSGVQGAEGRMDKADREWQWYCAQAQIASKALTLDEKENLTNSRRYLIPREQYSSFFGVSANPENRTPFNDPNLSNYHASTRY